LNEHEHEPIPGLPADLPEGETILWQGAPAWRALARRAFHVWQIGAYFILLLAWSGYTAATGGGGVIGFLWSALILAALAVAAIAVLSLIAWLTERTTMYSITNRRVVVRFGIALPMTINLPFRQIESAGLKLHADASGDIALALAGKTRIAFLVMWPHVRPWRLVRSEPMLRCVPDGARVAQILARALASAAAQPAPSAPADNQSRPATGATPRATAAA
jgi:hypothetical protein